MRDLSEVATSQNRDRDLTSGSLLARNTVWNLAGKVIPLLVAVASIPFLIEALGEEKFAVLALAWVIIGYFSLFDLGIGRSLTQVVSERLGAGRERDIGHIARTGLVVTGILGVVGGMVLYLLTPLLVSNILNVPQDLVAETVGAFRILSVAVPAVVSTAALRGLLEAEQRFALLNAVLIPTGVLLFLAPLAVLPFSDSLVWVLGALAAVRILAWVVFLVATLRLLPEASGAPPSHLGELLRIGGWMTVSNLVSPLMVYLDRFAIGAVLSLAAVSYYATPYEAVTKLVLPCIAVAGVFFPAFAATVARRPEAAGVLFGRSLRLIFMMAFPSLLLVAAFAPEGMSFWVGESFAAEGAGVARVLAVGVFLNGLAQVPFALVQGTGRADISAKFHLLEAPVYFVLLWLLLPTMGIVGAAVAWSVRVGLDTVLLFAASSRIVPQTGAAVRRAGPSTIVALTAFGTVMFVDDLGSRILIVALWLGTFGALAWSRLLDKGDREAIGRLMRVGGRGVTGVVLVSLLGATGTAAQLVVVPEIGDPADERLRIEQVLDGAATDGFLFRREGDVLRGIWEVGSIDDPDPDAPSPPPVGENSLEWAVVAPDLEATWNSDLPDGGNDGLMWAGRGVNVRLRSGAAFRRGRVRLVLAPELAYSQNEGFFVFPSGDDQRSGFASPFYTGRNSADLPLRFGIRSVIFVHPGQSTLSVGAGPARFAVSTANQWWGPGVRNALLLSNNAPGFFNLGVETDDPLVTPLGTLEGRWMVGSLVESPFFDDESTNDWRSLSGLIVILKPAGAETVSVGFARIVVAPLSELEHLPLRLPDVLTEWDPLPGSPGGEDPPATDALFSVFGRWIHPGAGVEVYGEWARQEHPTSFRELLTAPQHSQGWTVGMQWADELESTSARVRVQAEFTTLEQTRILPDRPTPPSFYTGRAAPHGFTNRGQILGAAVGPGGSGQWLAGDYLADGWSAGLFLGRTRHNNDALYSQTAANFFRHDVTVWGGARGDVRARGYRFDGRLSVGKRFNYLFQNGFANPKGFRTVDVWNVGVELGVTPEIDR